MNPPPLPPQLQAAREYFQAGHNPAQTHFSVQGDNKNGLLIYIPGGLPPLNVQTLLQAIHATYTDPDRVAEFLHDLGDR